MAAPIEARRLPLRRPEELASDQRALHERIAGGPRAGATATVPLTSEDGALLGPFAVMTLAPDIGDAVQQLGAALRFASRLDPLTREATILMVASHHRCEFEWFAHARAGRDAGLGETELQIILGGKVPDALPSAARASLTLVRSLLVRGSIDDREYTAALATLGERTMAELVWLAGYYSMLAGALATFEPPNPMSSGDVFTAQ